MKKIQIFVFLSFLLGFLSACAPGTSASVQVNTPSTSMQLTAPGGNPMTNQPDGNGRVARAGAGLWHGIIAPATLLVSFFNSDIRMYEVHNAGAEYDMGFFIGFVLVIAFIGFLIRLRR